MAIKQDILPKVYLGLCALKLGGIVMNSEQNKKEIQEAVLFKLILPIIALR